MHTLSPYGATHIENKIVVHTYTHNNKIILESHQQVILFDTAFWETTPNKEHINLLIIMAIIQIYAQSNIQVNKLPKVSTTKTTTILEY